MSYLLMELDQYGADGDCRTIDDGELVVAGHDLVVSEAG